MKKATIQGLFMSSYFDVSNYETPIKYFLDDFFLSLQYGRCVYLQSYFKKNYLDLHDDIFGLFSTKTNDYYYSHAKNEIFTTDDTYGPGEDVIYSQAVKLDKDYDIYERQVYTFTGVL